MIIRDGELVSVTFDVIVPHPAHDDEVEDWLQFHMHGECASVGNPLRDYEPAPENIKVIFPQKRA